MNLHHWLAFSQGKGSPSVHPTPPVVTKLSLGVGAAFDLMVTPELGMSCITVVCSILGEGYNPILIALSKLSEADVICVTFMNRTLELVVS